MTKQDNTAELLNNDKYWDPIMHLSLFELKTKMPKLAEELVENSLELEKEESVKYLKQEFTKYRNKKLLTDLDTLEPLIKKLAELEGANYLKELAYFTNKIFN